MRQFLSKAALLAVSVAITLGLIEAFLAWDNHYPESERSVVEINGFIYDFLEPIDRFAALDPSSRRVMLIGDSFTAGRNCVGRGENVSGHLDRRLEGRDDIDIINLGINGRDGAHFVEIIEAVQNGVGPSDDVVVILYDNDILLGEETCKLIDRQAAEFGITKPALCNDILAGAARPVDQDTWLKRLNVLMREDVRTFILVKEAAFNIPFLRGLYTREALGSKWEDLDSDVFRWMVDSIALMQQLVEAQGATFTLAYYPNVNAISADDPRHATWRTFIEALEAETGISTLDPYPYFIEHAPSSSLVWSLTDKHPNCTAHGIMADFLFETVIEDGAADRP